MQLTQKGMQVPTAEIPGLLLPDALAPNAVSLPPPCAGTCHMVELAKFDTLL